MPFLSREERLSVGQGRGWLALQPRDRQRSRSGACGYATWAESWTAPDNLENRPDLVAIANDPLIAGKIDEAWNASNPYMGPQRENGFWILRSDNDGALFTVNFSGPSTSNGITMDPMPNVPSAGVVATFHTHPNFGGGYVFGPSPRDIYEANRLNTPSIIRSHIGTYYYGGKR